MKVELAVLGSTCLPVLMVSVDVKPHLKVTTKLRSCVKVPNSPYGLCGRKATFEGHDRAQELCESPRLSCVKVEVAVLGSPSL